MVSSSSGAGSGLSSNDRLFFGGAASGLDTASIIDALTAVASRPITLAKQRVSLLENRQKALGQINSSLLNLLSSIDALRKPETGRARIATLLDSTQSTYLGVGAGPTAAVGSFTVDILGIATSTKTLSTAAIGSAVSAALALDKAGLETTPTSGTFTVNSTTFTIAAATTTNIVSSGAIGVAVNSSVPLASAGLTLTPTSGTFVINGTSITYDAAVDSLSAVISRINSSAAGVTAAFDAATQKLTLTRKENGPTAITLSNTSGNFLQAVNLVDGLNVKTGIETLGSDLISLNDVVAMVNGAAIGVTASLANDAEGRPNLLRLTSGAAIALGSAGDTSNFLAATHILESPAGTTRTSVRNLGTVAPSATLSAARLETALAPPQGSFTINGVSIAYDTTVDSLNAVISRINQSTAGVTATYDSYADKLRITNNATGTVAISLADTVGNFLTATKVLAATQTTGTNASYKINGGATQYATTNNVTDAVPGVSLAFKQATLTPITVNVAADTAQLRGRIEAFVTQFNSSMGLVASSTKFNEKGTSGTLLGDNTLQSLQSSLRTLVTSQAVGNSSTLNTLSSIGLTFGAVGTTAGTANTLTFDAAKFDAAMKSDAEGVVRLLTKFSASGALDAGGTGSLASVSGTPTSVKDSGKYVLLSAANGTVQVTFTPDNGGTAVTQTITVSPNEVNTTLIAGMTLTFGPVLLDGTNTISMTATEEGLGKALYEHVERYTRTGGVMAGRDDEIKSRITDLNAQIEKMQTRVDARRQALILRYAALETTIARLQSQQNALTTFVNKLAANKG